MITRGGATHPQAAPIFLNFRAHPSPSTFREPYPFNKVNGTSQALLYKYEVAAVGQPFWLKITRVSDGSSIFDTTGLDFIYSDKLLVIQSNIKNESLYGLGERNYNYKFAPGALG